MTTRKASDFKVGQRVEYRTDDPRLRNLCGTGVITKVGVGNISVKYDNTGKESQLCMLCNVRILEDAPADPTKIGEENEGLKSLIVQYSDEQMARFYRAYLRTINAYREEFEKRGFRVEHSVDGKKALGGKFESVRITKTETKEL